jgi:hypothetical protein
MTSRTLVTGNIRPAFTLIELVVSASLVIAGLAIFGQLTTATGRTWSQTRQQSVALEELSSQLDRLIALPNGKIDDAIAALNPSDAAADALPGVKLAAKRFDDRDGARIELSIDWDRGRPSQPMRLTGWIADTPASETETEESSR